MKCFIAIMTAIFALCTLDEKNESKVRSLSACYCVGIVVLAVMSI